MNDNSLVQLKALSQHAWLDNLSRTLFQEGVRLFAEAYKKLLAAMQ